MEGSEFEKYFEKVPHLMSHFLGVFSINTIPSRMKVRTFFVTNLSKSDSIGSHWIAILKPCKGVIEIFDSLGFRPDLVLPFLKFREKLTIEFNETQVQSLLSISCGKFVVMMTVERMLNLDLSFEMIFHDIFTENTEINEKNVIAFCESIIQM